MSDVNITKRELNLLVMGETGVGKSTFINNFVNVLSFQSLADAEKSEKMVSLIPSFFSLADDSVKSTVIRTRGIDMKNERTNVGESGTQSTRIYRIVMERMILRLIDTPGIGEGLEKDQQHMEDILRTISRQVDELDGIIILLKPNESRVGVVFRYCVEELLMQLHKTAAANIIFGFTNTRETFYKPGDTLPGLRKLLNESPDIGIPIKKDRVYCFDSESFRYLAAISNGISFNDESRAEFARSWDKFAVETNRLMDHISSIRPHDVKNTTSLNNVRQAVIRMIKPLSELMQMIDKTIGDLNQKKLDVSNLKESEEILSKSMFIFQEWIEKENTVCEWWACCVCQPEIFQNNGKRCKKYKRCHAYGSGGTGLYSCVCGHLYIDHMMFKYRWIQRKETALDPDIMTRLSNCKTMAEKKATVIRGIEIQIKECKSEYKFVQKAAATFALFLKLNAILPFTDTRIEYLDHMIERQKAQAYITKDYSVVKKLQHTKEEYMREFRILEEAIASGEATEAKDPEKMQEIEGELCSLNYFGKTFKSLKEAEMKKSDRLAPVINYNIGSVVDAVDDDDDEDIVIEEEKAKELITGNDLPVENTEEEEEEEEEENFSEVQPKDQTIVSDEGSEAQNLGKMQETEGKLSSLDDFDERMNLSQRTRVSESRGDSNGDFRWYGCCALPF